LVTKYKQIKDTLHYI